MNSPFETLTKKDRKRAAKAGASRRRAARVGRNSRAACEPNRSEKKGMSYDDTKAQAGVGKDYHGIKDIPMEHVTGPVSRRQLQRERAELRRALAERDNTIESLTRQFRATIEDRNAQAALYDGLLAEHDGLLAEGFWKTLRRAFGKLGRSRLKVTPLAPPSDGKTRAA